MIPRLALPPTSTQLVRIAKPTEQGLRVGRGADTVAGGASPKQNKARRIFVTQRSFEPFWFPSFCRARLGALMCWRLTMLGQAGSRHARRMRELPVG